MATEELKRVGGTLKGRRTELNLSLKDVESATSIRMTYLEAIEEGRASDFIAGIYAVGFMKQYAQFLGMDVESLMKQYPEAFLSAPEKHDFSYGIGTLEPRNGTGSSGKSASGALWALLGIGGVAILWLIGRYLGIFG